LNAKKKKGKAEVKGKKLRGNRRKGRRIQGRASSGRDARLKVGWRRGKEPMDHDQKRRQIP